MTLELLLIMCLSGERPCQLSEYPFPEETYIYLCVSPKDYRSVQYDSYELLDESGRKTLVLPTRCTNV